MTGPSRESSTVSTIKVVVVSWQMKALNNVKTSQFPKSLSSDHRGTANQRRKAQRWAKRDEQLSNRLQRMWSILTRPMQPRSVKIEKDLYHIQAPFCAEPCLFCRQSEIWTDVLRRRRNFTPTHLQQDRCIDSNCFAIAVGITMVVLRKTRNRLHDRRL